MACGLPIIASNVAGINNMIENNITGMLVPVKNDRALADAIYAIVSDTDKAATMKKAALDFALLNYSNMTMFTKYLLVFREALKI